MDIGPATFFINGCPSPGLVEITDAATPVGIDFGITPGVFTYECSFECTMGIRAWRMLSTGRPRPKRWVTKVRNAETRGLRRDLVRLAGWRRRQSDAQILSGVEISQLCLPLAGRVSVPRSLRPLLGRWIGGTRA